MHPKGIDMHPKVSIDLHPTTAYFAPNRSIDMHPKGVYMHPKVAAYMHPDYVIFLKILKVCRMVQDLSKSVPMVFREAKGSP